MNHLVRAALAALVLAGLAPAAEARIRLEGIYVYAEDPQPNDAACAISRPNLIPVVHAAMRAKGVFAARTSKDAEIGAYIMVHVLKVADVCSVAYGLQFYTGASTEYGQSKKRIFGVLEMCNEHGLMTGPADGLQDRVARAIGGYADRCIEEAEKKDE